MNILFITNNMPPLVDGVGDYTFNLAREFARHGHDVAVVCREDSRIKADYDDIKVFPVVRRWNKSAFKPIAGIIRQRQIEVVSLQYVPHGFHPKGLPFGLVGLVGRIKKCCNVRIITFFHELYLQFRFKELKRSVLGLGMRFICGRLLKCSDGVATSVPYYKGMLQCSGLVRSSKTNVRVMPIPSNVPLREMTSLEIDAFRKAIAPCGELVVSFFGSRNTYNSLRALGELKREHILLKVLVIGKGKVDLPPELVDCTICTGVLEISELGKYFRVTDIMLLPELTDSGCSFKSGALAAAMAFGLPVVTSQGLLTDPCMEDGDNVIFADFHSVAEIKRGINRLACSGSLRRLVGQKAKETVRNHTWGNVYDEYLQMLGL